MAELSTEEHRALTEELRLAYRAWFDALLVDTCSGSEYEQGVARASAECQRLEDQLAALESASS